MRGGDFFLVLNKYSQKANQKQGRLMMTRQEFVEVYEGGGRNRTQRYLRSLGADRDTAVDVGDAAWVKGYERIAQLRDPRCLVPWVNMIALNLFRDEVRLRKSTRQLLPQDERVASRETDLRVLDIKRALAKCAPRHGRLLVAFHCEGHSTRDLANQTGRSPGAVASELYRARQDFLEHMQGTKRHVSPVEGVLRMKEKKGNAAPSKRA